jgi:hypothetical protein
VVSYVFMMNGDVTGDIPAQNEARGASAPLARSSDDGGTAEPRFEDLGPLRVPGSLAEAYTQRA